MSYLEHYESIRERMDGFYKKVDSYNGIRELIEKNINDLNVKYKEIDQEVDLLHSARMVLQKITDERNKEAKESIRRLIDWALSSALQNNRYELIIKDEPYGNQGMVSRIELLELATNHVRSPNRGNGTAVKQTISTLFILSLVEYAKAARFFLFDEMFYGMSSQYSINFSDILAALAHNNHFQFIIVEQDSTKIFSNPYFEVIEFHLPSIEEGAKVLSIRESEPYDSATIEVDSIF